MNIEEATEILKKECTNTYSEQKAIAIETVLNTMYKLIEESAYYRDLVKLERKEKEQLKKSLKGQIAKKDKQIKLLEDQKQYVIDEYSETIAAQSKQIDLMAKEMYLELPVEFYKERKIEPQTIKAIIEYFKKKVDEENE